MDYVSFALGHPLYLAGALAGLIAVFALAFARRAPKKATASSALVLERLRKGFVVVRRAKLGREKNRSDYTLKVDDGRKFTVPKEKTQDAEVLNVPKAVTIAPGITRLFPIENGQLTKFNDTLADQSNPLLDNESVSAVQNRGSLRMLAHLSGGVNNWTMLILAAGAGIAVGYILYPMFTHPAPVFEYCAKYLNGTVGACSPVP